MPDCQSVLPVRRNPRADVGRCASNWPDLMRSAKEHDSDGAPQPVCLRATKRKTGTENSGQNRRQEKRGQENDGFASEQVTPAALWNQEPRGLKRKARPPTGLPRREPQIVAV